MNKHDTCPDCGANLDHGERCDCKNPQEAVAIAQTPNIEELLVVQQLPIIIAQIDMIEAQIDERISAVKSLAVTDENRKEIKNLRAQLNKEKKFFDDKRLEIRRQILAPFEEVDKAFKDKITAKYDDGVKAIDKKIKEIEDGLIATKRGDILSYFAEYLQSKGIDFITFENAKIAVNLTASVKSLKEQAKTFIDRIADDLGLIDTQEYKDEILVEYKKSLNASQAIMAITQRHKAIEDEKKRREEFAQRQTAERQVVEKVNEALSAAAEQEELTPDYTTSPREMYEQERDIAEQPENDPIRTLPLPNGIKHRVSRLRELKQYLIEGGFQF